MFIFIYIKFNDKYSSGSHGDSDNDAGEVGQMEGEGDELDCAAAAAAGQPQAYKHQPKTHARPGANGRVR